MRITNERRCIPISVLMAVRHLCRFSLITAVFSLSLSLAAVLTLWIHNKKNKKDTCGKIHENPLRRKDKSRYRSASLTVEASVAFPAFFFAVFYLIQMFLVLRAELVVAEAAITSARDVAAYSYAAERLADGENAIAEKILELFDRKLIRDTAVSSLLYARCDSEVLKQAGVGQDPGGIWVDTETSGDKMQTSIHYRVRPHNVLSSEPAGYYVLHLTYRGWTGEGKTAGTKAEGDEEETVVYFTDHGTVYHLDRNCSYIKINVMSALSEKIGYERNLSGARYYACEFCAPVLKNGVAVYYTKYGTRYHSASSCSAIRRSPGECSLEEAVKKYKPCSRCGKEKEDE